MLKSSIAITVLSTLCSLISFAAQLAIASQFGANDSLDQYLIASSLPALLSGAIASMLSYSLIPALVACRTNPAIFAAFAGSLLIRIFIAVLVTVVVGCVAAGRLVASYGALPESALKSVILMMRISWIWAGMLVIVSYLGCVLTAMRSYFLPVVVMALPYVGLLGFVVFATPALKIVALPVGTLAGSTAAAVLLLVRARPYLALGGQAAEIFSDRRQFLAGLPLVALAMSCFSSYSLIDAWWAPPLGSGALSALGYAQRLLIAIGNLVVVGPAAMLVSHMADVGYEGGEGAARARLLKIVQAMIGAGAALAVVGIFLAKPIVALLFQRGSFDATATGMVAGVLQIILAGIVPMMGSSTIFRGMFQLSAGRTAALLGLGWSLIYFTLSGIFSHVFGVNGIAAAYAVSWWLVFAAGLSWLGYSAGHSLRSTHGKAFAAICAASTVAAALFLLLVRSPDPITSVRSLNTLMRLSFTAGGGLLVYCTSFFLLGQFVGLFDGTGIGHSYDGV